MQPGRKTRKSFPPILRHGFEAHLPEKGHAAESSFLCLQKNSKISGCWYLQNSSRKGPMKTLQSSFSLGLYPLVIGQKAMENAPATADL